MIYIGSFAAPPPGQPVDQPYDEKNLKLGQQVEDLHDTTARKNFRVVIIRPDEVELVDLSDPNTARRQLYKYNRQNGEWSHQECWP
jgi:pyridoxamine 5'-phosphate oxidase